MKQILYLLLILIFSFQCFAQDLILPVPEFDKMKVSDSFPIQFDLRGTGRLNSVKAQPTGGCWASASMGAVESVMRTFGFGNYTFSDIDLKISHGFDSTRSTFGNHYMATAYFTRFSGPLLRQKVSDSLHEPQKPDIAYITDARFLPNNPKLMKQTIIDYGAVYSMLYYKSDFLDTLNYTYYTDVEKINHAVDIVGWDDTIKTTAGRGAWIAQNSMGKNFGDQGYFYISYADRNILNYNAVWPNWIPYDSTSSIYYYDTLGATIPFGYHDTICCGLVKYTANENLWINKVGTSVTTAGTRILTKVYANFNEDSKRLSRQKYTITEKECKMAGYYTFHIDEPVFVKKGNDFYIMMQYVTPNDSVPLPTEAYLKDYADPHITTGKCWVNANVNKWPNAWYPLGKGSEYESLHFDLCIKVYTVKANTK